ncbi:hypothetical protein PV08_08498 [Exophiala spinifera]|uniref:Uncharacterized protein n=1 Tax=Exophiala spinifera TaxID=91928 RepID=A0A0D2B3Q4_9EURO|nr:uncharacterized protein PV08_08498 [Exophiala spinifera]KIW13310.1 hypothetical protein PV08_08498 [Exophiala spinifera]
MTVPSYDDDDDDGSEVGDGVRLGLELGLGLELVFKLILILGISCGGGGGVVTFNAAVEDIGIVILLLRLVVSVTAIMDVVSIGKVDGGPAIVVPGATNAEAVTVRVCIMTDCTVAFNDTVTVTVAVTAFVHSAVCVVWVVVFAVAVIGKTENSSDRDDKTCGSVIFGSAPRSLTLLADDWFRALEGNSTTTVVFMYAVCVRVAVIQTELVSDGKETTPEEPLEEGGTRSEGKESCMVVATVAFTISDEDVGRRGLSVVEFEIGNSCVLPVDTGFGAENVACEVKEATRVDHVLVASNDIITVS